MNLSPNATANRAGKAPDGEVGGLSGGMIGECLPRILQEIKEEMEENSTIRRLLEKGV